MAGKGRFPGREATHPLSPHLLHPHLRQPKKNGQKFDPREGLNLEMLLVGKQEKSEKGEVAKRVWGSLSRRPLTQRVSGKN